MSEQAEFDRLSAAVAVGRGVVARFPGLLCVADATDPEPVRALLALCGAVAGFEPGRPLARRLAAWLTGPKAPPSSLHFGTLADAGDRWAVFLAGPVSLHDIGADTTIDGVDAAAWTDRLIEPGGPMVLSIDGAKPGDNGLAALHDLRAGTVPGRGVMLAAAEPSPNVGLPTQRPAAVAHAASAPPPAAAPAPPPAEPQPSPPRVPDEEPTEMTIGDGSGAPPYPARPTAHEPPAVPAPRRSERIDKAPPPPPRAPLELGRPLTPVRPRGQDNARQGAPDAGRGERLAERPEESPVVEGPRTRGHLCARGHLNDPRSHFCVLCGIRMNERTGELVYGARPPLGLLVFDDGATYTVDAEYLVGRMPDVDERVRNGSLRSIVIEDRSGAISRVHAEVRVDGWDVLLVDSKSRNGTHVAEPGTAAWKPVPVGRSHRLTPGTRVRLGGRTFLFESPSGVR
jgi:hypothetical protein